MTPTPDHYAASDLLRVLQVALPRGAHLLTPAENQRLIALKSLPLPVLDSWARAVKRRHPIQRVQAIEASESLIEAGLVEPITGPACIGRLTVPELHTYLRQAGRPARSNTRRPALLQAALQVPAGPLPARFLHVQHRALWLRAWRCFTLRAFPDPDLPVLQRLGIRSWPTYQPTKGALLWRDRDHLLGWEQLADTLLQSTEPELLVRAAHAPEAAAPGRLDLRRLLRRRLWELGSELENEQPQRATTCFEALLDTRDRYAHRARLRLAMLHERRGRAESGLRLLQQARPHTTGWRRMALSRTGKRLARVCRESWAPDLPLPPIRQRRIPLVLTDESGPRPRFRGLVVEQATIRRLAELGRTALHTEGALWRHLFALLFAPHCYFAPVEGALPAPYLSGPLDLGTPAFAQRRQEPIAQTWSQIERGEAEQLVRATHDRFAGTHLAGARWERTVDEDIALVRAIGAPVLVAVLQALLQDGLRASRGMPDLLVLPGEPVRWPGAHPSRLGPQLCFAELKTPNDTLSDAQRWWLARLDPVARVEVWQVQPERHTRER